MALAAAGRGHVRSSRRQREPSHGSRATWARRGRARRRRRGHGVECARTPDPARRTAGPPPVPRDPGRGHSGPARFPGRRGAGRARQRHGGGKRPASAGERDGAAGERDHAAHRRDRGGGFGSGTAGGHRGTRHRGRRRAGPVSSAAVGQPQGGGMGSRRRRGLTVTGPGPSRRTAPDRRRARRSHAHRAGTRRDDRAPRDQAGLRGATGDLAAAVHATAVPQRMGTGSGRRADRRVRRRARRAGQPPLLRLHCAGLTAGRAADRGSHRPRQGGTARVSRQP